MVLKWWAWLSQPISLALYSLKELLLENAVGGIERNAHPLAASRGDWKGVSIATANHVQGDGHTYETSKHDNH